MHTGIHNSIGIGTHYLGVLADEDSSCLRRRGHCDRHMKFYFWYLTADNNDLTTWVPGTNELPVQ
jgi:hypothetical protein